MERERGRGLELGLGTYWQRPAYCGSKILPPLRADFSRHNLLGRIVLSTKSSDDQKFCQPVHELFAHAELEGARAWMDAYSWTLSVEGSV